MENDCATIRLCNTICGHYIKAWPIVAATEAMGAKLLQSSLLCSRLERDLQVDDLRVLCDFAFFRNDRPPSAIVDRLCERGYVAKTTRGRARRMTLKGSVAVLLRQTVARRDRTEMLDA